MKVINVAVGIILNSSKSKVLLAQRNTEDEHYGQWEFPGGKINADESTQDALKREIKEELNIEVVSSEVFDEFEFEYIQRKVNLIFHLVTNFKGAEKGNEGQEILWVDIKNLHTINMLEANKSIIEKIQLNF